MNDNETHTFLNDEEYQMKLDEFSEEIVGQVTREMKVLIGNIMDPDYDGILAGTFITNAVIEVSDGVLKEFPFVVGILVPDELIYG